MVAGNKSDLLEDVLKIASSIVSERDLRKLSDMLLSSISSLFGFGKVSLLVYDEAEGAFKWMALFGFPEGVMKEARTRSVSTDVILDDLHEVRRIGRSAYFTPVEEMTTRQLDHFVRPRNYGARVPAHGVRSKDSYWPDDCLAFALHDSSGRIVGVIYPSNPADGRIPSPDTIETMEILVSLCEVAIENARLTLDREQALRISNQRTEQLSRILDLASTIMYVRDLDELLNTLLRTLARLLGMKRMVIGVRHESEGVYKVEAVHGYSPKAAEMIKSLPYPIYQVDAVLNTSETVPSGSAVKWTKKMGRMTYYLPGESSEFPFHEEMPYYPEPENLRRPRRGKGYWHDLDWMDTYISDRTGKPIAYLEILKPRDEMIPDSETVEVIEVFATLAGIAIENSRLLQEQIDSRRNAELYTDVLSHDIKNFNQAILGYLELLRMTADKPEARALLGKISEQVMNTNWLASNVRTMSRVTFGEVELSRKDLSAVLHQCVKSMVQYFPGRKTSVKSDFEKHQMFTNADDLVWELFTNVLTNSVKYDSHEVVEIEISAERKTEAGRHFWVVSIADHGCGIPDEAKSIVFDRFTKAPQKKGSGMGMHIVKALSVRYGGKVWVEDRVKGDHTKGTVVHVQLPAID